MTIAEQLIKPVILGAALTAIGLVGLSVSATVSQAADTQRIEVVIKDKSYKVTGHSLPGELTTMVIKNDDVIEHGFTSPLLFDVPVKMEGEGLYIKGKGVRAYHIRPGKSITLTFTKGSTKDVETQRIPFTCDLHPDMKGELFVVETKGEVGGG